MSEKPHFRVFIPRIIAGLVAALAIFYIIKVIIGFIDEKPAKKDKKIQAITLLKPPPPPPPPPKVEKPPEPEVKEKIKEPEPEPEPEPLPDTPPDEAPARDLGIDAQATAGSDGFGLKARKGGNGLFGGGNPYAGYGSQVAKSLNKILNGYDELRRKGYFAIVKVWLKADGSVERIELAKGSNDPAIDEVLTKALGKIRNQPLGNIPAPPPGMPQPIKLKITDRI